MSTLTEIESAARKLPADQKQKLLLLIAQSLRDERPSLPEPRQFSLQEMQAWIAEDDEDMARLRVKK